MTEPTTTGPPPTEPVRTEHARTHPAGEPCRVDLLRSLFLFEKLDDEQLGWLCREGSLLDVEPGTVFTEGEPATCFYVLVSGSIVLSGKSGTDEVEITRADQPGVYAGAWQAYLGDRVPQVYNNSMRALEPTRLFVLDAQTLTEMMSSWFPMALHLLEGLFFGIQNVFQSIGQRERLLALGALSAGLTHELNNPASSAVRATGALRERVAGMRHKLGILAGAGYERADLDALIRLQEEAAEQVAKAPVLGPLEASDREDALGDWLDEHEVADGWDLAPIFVQAGFDAAWLDRVAGTVGPINLSSAMRWLGYTIETELLMDEIADSTTRISTLLASAKQYSQLDRGPFQSVDVHDLLDSTLVMLASKVGAGVSVVKEYDRSLPPIDAYGAELNQVWTNLIDNALAAMAGSGTLTVRTGSDGAARVFVEIGDTGPGIAPENRDRVFQPFFTTKAVGEGTGLGLDISYRIVVQRHHGELRLESVPGDTRFRVVIPQRQT